MFRYFGFGSNMSLTALRAKGVEPLSAQKATLPGWRLRFNVQHFFRHEGGVGNVEPVGDAMSEVQGVLYECPDEALAPLDATEAYGHGYDRLTVTVETAQGPQNAYVYVGTEAFLDDECLPTQRYLNILIAGAQSAELDQDYIAQLRAHPVMPAPEYPLFSAPAGTFPTFTTDTLSQQPSYTALGGHVFDMAEARPLHDYLKTFFAAQDMTLFHLKRLDSSNGEETLEDIRHQRLNEAQQRYLNAYLNEYAREYRYVGRFEYDTD